MKWIDVGVLLQFQLAASKYADGDYSFLKDTAAFISTFEQVESWINYLTILIPTLTQELAIR